MNLRRGIAHKKFWLFNKKQVAFELWLICSPPSAVCRLWSTWRYCMWYWAGQIKWTWPDLTHQLKPQGFLWISSKQRGKGWRTCLVFMYCTLLIHAALECHALKWKTSRFDRQMLSDHRDLSFVQRWNEKMKNKDCDSWRCIFWHRNQLKKEKLCSRLSNLCVTVSLPWLCFSG